MTARFLAGASDGLKQKSRVSRQKKKKKTGLIGKGDYWLSFGHEV